MLIPSALHLQPQLHVPYSLHLPHLQARRHFQDEPIPDQHISLELAVGVDNGAALQSVQECAGGERAVGTGRVGRRRVHPVSDGGPAGVCDC